MTDRDRTDESRESLSHEEEFEGFKANYAQNYLPPLARSTLGGVEA